MRYLVSDVVSLLQFLHNSFKYQPDIADRALRRLQLLGSCLFRYVRQCTGHHHTTLFAGVVSFIDGTCSSGVCSMVSQRALPPSPRPPRSWSIMTPTRSGLKKS